MRPDPARDRRRRPTRRGGFTLIELGVVVLIIGLLASFILVVSNEGIERARERATQGLIAKLDAAMTDRLARLQNRDVRPNLYHRWLGAVLTLPPGDSIPTPASYTTRFQDFDVLNGPPNVAAIQAIGALTPRAELIAKMDFLRAEFPEVFFLQFDSTAIPNPVASPSSIVYPLNFGGRPYYSVPTPFPPLHPDVASAGAVGYSVLPIGNSVVCIPNLYTVDRPPQGDARDLSTYPALPPPAPGYSAFGTGIYGASYSTAAGIYKNLGYLPRGYDGVDSNGNGWIDEWDEGVFDPITGASPEVPDPDSTEVPPVLIKLSDLVRRRLANHTHDTARSEMLYALLVEGPDALLTRDSFAGTEVADTDNDGLLEFVDGWGRPLLFFLWPTHYQSDLQKGINPRGFDGVDDNGTGGPDDPAERYAYPLPSVTREQNPYDPSQLLMSPAWWSNMFETTNSANYKYPSEKAKAFQNYFLPLIDPTMTTGNIDAGLWDRSGYYKRRAFFVKHLILSAGPDNAYGVPLWTQARIDTAKLNATTANKVLDDLILAENTAGRVQLNDENAASPNNAYRQQPGNSPMATKELFEFGGDDITNHQLKAPGAGLR